MSLYSGAHVLITGGLGFIGSNLGIRLLEEGASVTLVDSLIPEYGGNPANIRGYESRLKVNISDVRDPHSMKTLVKGHDFLFNLAGQTSHMDSMADPYTDLDINCKAQLSILEACRNANPGIRIVFAGTRRFTASPTICPWTKTTPSAPSTSTASTRWPANGTISSTTTCTASAPARCASPTPSGRVCASRTPARPSRRVDQAGAHRQAV